ncbi:type 2 periplasmic-binding domain-containing protein [Methyloversatilis thermotolerans]|uniref:hypothetical protein n=1 Tax=Methyloversatilis thermotolerans TaxID=1346290 RepID=UPI00035D2CF8|nr:hypothetical protein [Methyloversatilis thermotolerans]
MQLKKIALAVAAMATGFAAHAAGTVNIGGVPHNVVYLSGASAPDAFLADIAEGMLTGVTYYTASNYKAYAGSASGVPGVTNGTKVLFIKRSEGGSAFGVGPVARAQRVKTIDVNNCTSGAGTKASPYSCNIMGTLDPGSQGYGEAGDAANAGLVPDFGISDVEPAMFQEPYNTESDTAALSSSEVSRLAVLPVNQIMMGLVATNNVPASTYLSRSTYGAMLNGQITTWDQVDPTLEGDVVVCRRVEGSGTQTSYNWFFGNFPCATQEGGAVAPARMSDSYGWKEGGSGTSADPYIINPASGYTVIENSSSGNVRSCMNAAHDGSDYTFTSWDSEDGGPRVFKVTFSESGPMKAVGVLSLDSYTSAASNDFSFRHLDGAGTYTYDSVSKTLSSSAGATGIAPSKANLIDGKYDFVVELSSQYRNVAVTNEFGDAVPAISGVQKAFADEFVKRAGSPRYTGNLGNTVAPVSTPDAYASLPQYYAGTASSNLYVSKFTRNANTCAPLQFRGN